MRHFLLGRASMRVPVVALGLLGLLALPTFAPTQTPKAGAQSSEPSGGLTDSDLTTLLAEEFRIDISTIDVKYDYRPSRSTIEGSATLVFTMRPGQTRPLFHFDPYTRGQTVRQALQTIELNGESLDPTSSADLRRHRSARSDQVAFEIQRDVDATNEHTLEISWSIWNWYEVRHPGRGFYMDLNDVPGRGGDMLWPTINSPEELARHRIRVRVHGDAEYTMIGSGVVSERPNANVQTWRLDTEREISSATVFFAAVPTERFTTYEFEVEGVPVTIVSDRSEDVVARAQSITERTLPQLIADFGPFPMPSMQIFLIRWGDGMEYYGATKTGIGALKHELVHMWWGSSAVNRTYRDTWFDEAVTVWWLDRNHLRPLGSSYASDIVSGQTAVDIGFDGRAYGAGARLISEVADAMGGDDAFISFLADLYQRRAFAPFTTNEFIADVHAETGDDELRARLIRALFTHVVRCDGHPVTIAGTPGDDTIVGTDGDDVIQGLAGNDTILGLGGNDLICGGRGDDRIEAGPGEDEVFGRHGADTIDGGPGADTIDSGPGPDEVFGRGGPDEIDGGNGSDTLRGGRGADELTGGPGRDTLVGGLGADRCRDSTVRDTIRGCESVS